MLISGCFRTLYLLLPLTLLIPLLTVHLLNSLHLMNEQNVMIHTYNRIFSALKRNTILTHATTRMTLKDIMLSETNQSQKVKYYMIPLI